jgi:hypothetical protein
MIIFSFGFRLWLMCAVWCMMLGSLRAVEMAPAGSSPYYNSSNNISSTVSSWTNASWGSGNTNTGWDYVGSMNGASGVYLGKGWVLTAAHVGAGNFTLGTNTYPWDGYSVTNFTITIGGTNYASDINLFRISTNSSTGSVLSLPPLVLNSNAPTVFSGRSTTNTSRVVMIGNGGGKSWGVNNVTSINQGVTVLSYGTADFSTAFGTNTSGSATVVNNAKFITGDSGGGAFMLIGSQWLLTGINEAVDNNGNSYMVQLSYYASTISSAIASAPAPTPTPTPTPTPSATPTPTPSPTPTATPSPSVMPSPSPSPSPAAPVSDEPTMPQWGLILMALLLAGYVLRTTHADRRSP